MNASEYIANVLATNEIKRNLPVARPYWLDTLYLANIHVRGIKPRYKNLRLYSDASYLMQEENARFGGTWITPTGWASKYQPYFEQLILNRYPTVREERFNWQCSIYPNFAQSLFLQAIDEIRGAIFQENNYEYKFANESTAAYVMEKRFEQLDFYDWVTNVLIIHIITDPNGYLVTMPSDWDSDTGEIGQPALKYVASEDVLYADTDLLVYKDNGYAYIIDAETYYKIPYNRKTKRYDLANIETLPHTLTEAPFTVLGGYKMYSNDSGGYYLSFFNGALDWANIAVRQFIDTEALNKDIVPITQMVQIECGACHGTGSIPVPCPDGDYGGCSDTCKTCNGKGHISRNMGDVISIDPSEIIDGRLPQYLQYISGDVANLKYSDERFNEMYDRFLQALYLKFIDEAQSGVAKAMDREKLYKFLLSFSDNIFDIITDCLARIDGLLNNTAADLNALSIRRPTQFILKTEEALRDELRQLTTAGAPDNVIRTIADALTLAAAQSPLTEKTVSFLSLYDPLRYKTDAQKTALVNVAGAFTRNDLIKSLRCENELNKLIEAKTVDWFMMATYEVIAAALDAALQPYYQSAAVIELPDFE